MQIGRHQERSLQSLISEVGGAGIDIAGTVVSQVVAHHEYQVEAVRTQRSRIWRSIGAGRAAASGDYRQYEEKQCNENLVQVHEVISRRSFMQTSCLMMMNILSI